MNRAFSLVELLVVISIIALLIALLLPAMGKAKELSRQTACRSNLHQMGVSFNAYASSHRGWFPVNHQRWPTTVAVSENATMTPTKAGYSDARAAMAAHVDSTSIFYCPSEVTRVPPGGKEFLVVGASPEFAADTTYVLMVGLRPPTSSSDWSFRLPSTTQTYPLPHRSFNADAKRPLAADLTWSAWNAGLGTQTKPAGGNHRRGADVIGGNAMLPDGSARWSTEVQPGVLRKFSGGLWDAHFFW